MAKKDTNKGKLSVMIPQDLLDAVGDFQKDTYGVDQATAICMLLSAALNDKKDSD